MSVCDIPVISTVCDAVGEGAASLVSAPFDWLAATMGQAAAWLIEAMWTVFDSTTLVDVQSSGYLDVYNLLFGIGVFIVLLFFCFQLVLGLIRREPAALSRAALGAAKAVLGSFVVVTLTATGLEIVDQLCVGIVQAAGETTATMGDKIALLTAGLTTINIAAPGVGAIITIFLSGLMICAVAIVWFSLLIRKALLLVAIVLAPIAFAGAAWDVTRGWIGKWAAFVVALIISKLVLVVVFLIAITQVSTPIEADLASVTEPISGIVLLFIAAFAPYMVYRFISFFGFDLYHAMGSEQEAKNAINRPVPVPSKPQGDGVKKVLDGGSGGGPSTTPPRALHRARRRRLAPPPAELRLARVRALELVPELVPRPGPLQPSSLAPKSSRALLLLDRRSARASVAPPRQLRRARETGGLRHPQHPRPLGRLPHRSRRPRAQIPLRPVGRDRSLPGRNDASCRMISTTDEPETSSR